MNEDMTPDAVVQKILIQIDELKLEHMFEPEANKRYYVQKKIDDLKQRLLDEFGIEYKDVQE